jgi:hypothetical protein
VDVSIVRVIAASNERSGQQKRFGASLKPAATQNAERPLAEGRVVPQRACIAHMYIRAFLITALCLPSRCKPSARLVGLVFTPKLEICRAQHLRLTAEPAFGSDLARHACNLAGERVQLIDHRIDGLFQL